MSEENYIIEKRHKKAKLYRNKLRRIFKKEVYLLNDLLPEMGETIGYFKVIIENKVYFISYVPIEKVKFKDMLRQIYESYWYDIFDKYINFAEITKYLPIREKGE